MEQFILNFSRFFKKEQNVSGEKEKNNKSVTTNEKGSTENPKPPAYYETLISKYSKDNRDYLDFSGGLLGI